jgi:hypothetical protein
MIKSWVHPDTGRHLKFGRTQVIARAPSLKLARYLDMAALPPVPLSTDYRSKSEPFLHNILGNDQLGDCTAAGAFHLSANMLGAADNAIGYTAADAIAFYSASTGYVPGESWTDQGGNVPDVLNYWVQHGLMGDGSHKAAGWVTLDPTNKRELQVSVDYFGGCYLGLCLPDAWEPQSGFGDGFTWDVAGDPDPSNGHCIVAIDYLTGGLIVDTWGDLGLLTWAAVAKYCSASAGGEICGVVSHDALSQISGKSPTGLNGQQFVADFDSFFGATA